MEAREAGRNFRTHPGRRRTPAAVIATGTVLQALTEVANQTSPPAASLPGVLFHCLDPCLGTAAALADRTPVYRASFGPELTAQPLG